MTSGALQFAFAGVSIADAVVAGNRVDHLDQLALRLFDAGDVVECHPVAGGLVASGARATECPERALRAASVCGSCHLQGGSSPGGRPLAPQWRL